MSHEPCWLDERLGRLEPGPVPDGLLERCLATIPGSDRDADKTGRRHGPSPWRRKAKALAMVAAVVLIGALGLLVRPREAAATHLIRAVRDAWTRVPASHRVVRRERPGGRRTEETWFVRDKGSRKETHDEQGRLTGVVIRNRRWEFHWDLPGRMVAAWSTEMDQRHRSPEEDGLILESESYLRWAEANRADVHVEDDMLGPRKVRKAVLRWPGTGGDAGGVQLNIVWFDPGSLRPLREKFRPGFGDLIETEIDYPAPAAVSDDMFTLRPPRDVTIEINDPDLGRQVYSDGQPGGTDSSPRARDQDGDGR